MAAFALRYPDQPTPKTERIIKEKLLAGLPSAKAELGHCLGDEYPLDKSNRPTEIRTESGPVAGKHEEIYHSFDTQRDMVSLLQVWRPLSERLSARSSSGCLL